MDIPTNALDLVRYVVDLFLHLDVHLGAMVATFGPWLYVLAFAIIFCETGLVVMPFLPGDSFLFALGALAALEGSPLNLGVLGLLLFVAAVLGDGCNYAIGQRLGARILRFPGIKAAHLQKTQEFYLRHGGKTIILARFIPIIRTFAPFVAGLGRMPYRRFALYNVAGAALWVTPLLGGGYFLGNTPVVKRNFHIVILAIIVVSLMPAVMEFLRHKWAQRTRVNGAV